MQPGLPATATNVTHALFRCAQEALTNAARHGFAAKVLLSLKHHQESSVSFESALGKGFCADIQFRFTRRPRSVSSHPGGG